MANGLLPKQHAQAQRMGWLAVGGWGLSALLFVKASSFLAIIAIGAAVYLTVRWFRFRASWGMRF